ncbi:hypothetical protein [Helicobacter pylori]|uniref:hypothetical protein n=1 Tax=Helicobacter pylori TaxID=210 RepID=UPI001883B10B|nr:hypothetical protein [Helicobacter pylori]
MNVKELAVLKDYLDTAMIPKREELFKIRGAKVSECFIEPKLGDGGVVKLKC